jgi:hypothetical protein
MRKLTGILAVCLLLLAATSAQAQKLGAGIFVGMNIPVVQDDAGSGTVFGFRGQFQAIPLIRVEPHLSFIKNGDYDAPGIGGPFSLDGGKLTSFGLNGILGTPMGGPGLGIGLVAGIGSYKYKVEGYEDDTRVGYSGGLDLSLGLTGAPVKLNGRGELLVLPLEDGGSRKHALLTVGAIYSFGPR